MPMALACTKHHLPMHQSQTPGYRERIIVLLDRPSGQLKSTSPSLYRLPYFVYTSCRCRRGQRRRVLLHQPLLHWPFTIQSWAAGVEEAGVESRCRRRLPRLDRHPPLHRHPRCRQQSAGLEVRLYAPLATPYNVILFLGSLLLESYLKIKWELYFKANLLVLRFYMEDCACSFTFIEKYLQKTI